MYGCLRMVSGNNTSRFLEVASYRVCGNPCAQVVSDLIPAHDWRASLAAMSRR